MAIGDKRYKEARERAGLRPEEACAKLGISIGTLYNWESGKTKPDANDIVNMSLTYDASSDYLLGLA